MTELPRAITPVCRTHGWLLRRLLHRAASRFFFRHDFNYLTIGACIKCEHASETFARWQPAGSILFQLLPPRGKAVRSLRTIHMDHVLPLGFQLFHPTCASALHTHHQLIRHTTKLTAHSGNISRDERTLLFFVDRAALDGTARIAYTSTTGETRPVPRTPSRSAISPRKTQRELTHPPGLTCEVKSFNDPETGPSSAWWVSVPSFVYPPTER